MGRDSSAALVLRDALAARALLRMRADQYLQRQPAMCRRVDISACMPCRHSWRFTEDARCERSINLSAAKSQRNCAPGWPPVRTFLISPNASLHRSSSKYDQDRDMSMPSHSIPSGRARRGRNPVAIAIGAAVALLVILALLGVHPLALALVGLLSLGSILILTDRTARIESDSYTLLV